MSDEQEPRKPEELESSKETERDTSEPWAKLSSGDKENR
jgi:hypothetical protein